MVGRDIFIVQKELHERPAELRERERRKEQREEKKFQHKHILRAIQNKSASQYEMWKMMQYNKWRKILFQWLVLTINCVFTHIQSTAFIQVAFTNDMKNFHCIVTSTGNLFPDALFFFFTAMEIPYFPKICKHYVRENVLEFNLRFHTNT